MPTVSELVIVALSVLIGCALFSSLFDYVYEDTMLRLMPSAERAYAYGSRHFDAKKPRDYDIKRAERLFYYTLQLDPQYPFVQHQLARIAFLKGDFTTALARIDAEIEKHPNPSSHYVRGLIYGYKGEYAKAAEDYEAFLRTEPENWAGINDYAWVLLKAKRPSEALVAVDWGLMYWPRNPWLLNSKATAHFEMSQIELAEEAAGLAAEYVGSVTEADWLKAYPGNDPLVAPQGIRALQNAVRENVNTIRAARDHAGKNVQ